MARLFQYRFGAGQRPGRAQLRQPVHRRDERHHGQLRGGDPRGEPRSRRARPDPAVDPGERDPLRRAGGRRAHVRRRVQDLGGQPADPSGSTSSRIGQRPSRTPSGRSWTPTSSIIGPGSLYTSILPNLLVDGIAKARRLDRGAQNCTSATWPPSPARPTSSAPATTYRRCSSTCASRPIDVVLANDNLSGVNQARMARPARRRGR